MSIRYVHRPEAGDPAGGERWKAAMEEITLCVMTRELCHWLFQGWENDPDIYADMGRFGAYHYNEAAVNRYFDAKQDSSRVMLAVMKDGTPLMCWG